MFDYSDYNVKTLIWNAIFLMITILTALLTVIIF